MFMQSLMLLAVDRGLDTCAQEFWARYPQTVAKFVNLPDDHMVFSGMAMGYRDPPTRSTLAHATRPLRGLV